MICQQGIRHEKMSHKNKWDCSTTCRDCERTNSVEIKRVEHKNIFKF
jgi:hypothetical protein